MISAGLLHHNLIIERSTDGARDDYGNPAQTWATLATVRGLVQPKNVREIAQLSQAGPVAGEQTIYLYPTDLREGDRIRREDDGEVFQITGVRDAGGASHHLEVDAHLVTSAA